MAPRFQEGLSTARTPASMADRTSPLMQPCIVRLRITKTPRHNQQRKERALVDLTNDHGSCQLLFSLYLLALHWRTGKGSTWVWEDSPSPLSMHTRFVLPLSSSQEHRLHLHHLRRWHVRRSQMPSNNSPSHDPFTAPLGVIHEWGSRLEKEK